MKAQRVVVVGCGYFGQKRIQALAGIAQQCKLVGVVDRNITLAKKFALQYNIPCATSLTQLLQRVSVDFAIIAVPNAYHATCTIEALSSGLHVLCEKPIAATIRDANRIVQASKKYHVFVKTGSNHRFLPTIQRAHKLFSSRRIGNILFLKGSIGNNGFRIQHKWFWNPQVSGGGTLIDNGCHVVDIARWFMGDFVSCVGSTSSLFWKQAATEDLGVGIFKTKNGSQAIITSSWTQWTGYLTLELWGDKGYIYVDTKKENVIVVGNKDGTREQTYIIKEPQYSSYQRELLYFSSCIRNNKEPSPNAADGARVIELIHGIYKSAKSNKKICL